jgi:hypothetical protein
VDTFILGDPAPLRKLKGRLAAAPSARPRIPEAIWERLYRDFRMAVPGERIRSIGGELSVLKTREQVAWQERERNRMVPYYNSGVVVAPRNCSLRSLWEDYIRRIGAAVSEQDGPIKVIHQSDQAGLAVAIQAMRNRGATFEMLPQSWHVNWRHLYAGAVAVNDAVIYHACGFMRGMGCARVTEGKLSECVSEYCHRKLKQSFREAMWIDVKQFEWRRAINSYLRGISQAKELRRKLTHLCGQYIYPVLRESHVVCAC